MAILVDEARWEWRGLRWAHLVSDHSYDELHAFAARLGLRRIAFQGDHYDIPAELRPAALASGAEPLPARELVVRLRRAGLRSRGPSSPWTRVWQRAAPSRFDSASASAVVRALGLQAHAAKTWITGMAADAPLLADQGAMALVRGAERALTIDLAPPAAALDLTYGGDPAVIHRVQRAGSVGLEVVWLV